jgi:hypothetical protein
MSWTDGNPRKTRRLGDPRPLPVERKNYIIGGRDKFSIVLQTFGKDSKYDYFIDFVELPSFRAGPNFVGSQEGTFGIWQSGSTPVITAEVGKCRYLVLFSKDMSALNIKTVSWSGQARCYDPGTYDRRVGEQEKEEVLELIKKNQKEKIAGRSASGSVVQASVAMMSVALAVVALF